MQAARIRGARPALVNERTHRAACAGAAAGAVWAPGVGDIGRMIGTVGALAPAPPSMNCGTWPFQRSFDWASTWRM
jgi:hypothetical protein